MKNTTPNESTPSIKRPGVAARALGHVLTPAVLMGAMMLTTAAHASRDPWSSAALSDYAWSTARGDFNADGREDVVFGYPRYNGGGGLVAIHFGTGNPRHEVAPHSGSSEPVFEDELESRYLLLDGDEAVFLFSGVARSPGQHLGTSVSVGDFDKDGYDDLAFGIPGATVNGIAGAGAVVIIEGEHLGDATTAPTTGAARRITQSTTGVTGSSAESYDYFGDVLAAGDLNCDGYDDLAVGVPREDWNSVTDAGMVHVLYGSAAQLLGGPSSSFLYQGGGPLSETTESYDRFGSSLAIGHFTPANYAGFRACNSLAIGVPDEDVVSGGVTRIDAGVVHLLEAVSYDGGGVFGGFQPITNGVEVLIDQNYTNVSSAPEAYDRFGASVGRVAGSQLDSLWIGVPGEGWGSCAEGIVHTLTYNGGEVLTCSSVRPDVLEAEAGHVVQKFDSYGGWLQYVPRGLDPATAQVFVIAHGTNRYTSTATADWPGGLANTHRYMNYDGFVAAADMLGFVLVMPQFEDWSFGNDYNYADNAGGYRALLGRDINADEWVERIVGRYAAAGLGDGRFHLFGHSAGGQFALRYLTQHPEKLLEVILESPGQMVNGKSGATWPQGLGALSLPNSSWGSLSYSPSASAMQTAVTTLGALMVVGEQDNSSNLNVFNTWTSTFPDSWGPDAIGHCMVTGTKHDSTALHRTALRTMWPILNLHSVFENAPSCM
ncbi:MAG TPA: alpha/beta fold hydrolase [Myxococcaceae bacterium]|nr:alpha/beta fold hydrolase [Myxococcaceae bacterium]